MSLDLTSLFGVALCAAERLLSTRMCVFSPDALAAALVATVGLLSIVLHVLYEVFGHHDEGEIALST